ncbi:hypothetical protein PEBR_14369 [Penicillium brasilianum]|uniref:Rhodopsin domain-containing protein n=1 Tax=Penicillium brasilianum TaxID=104259 RepID=A0A1S9RRV3_PENBI|nr:hypothetical protein PEBR_14369 [Penicillium brasilianum]
MAFDINVDYSETRAAEINTIGWVFTGIAIAAVSLKLFSRVESKRAGWDDFFIFLSMALSIIATAFVSYSVTLGLGRHAAAVIAEHGIERYELSAYWQIIAYPFNIGAFSFPNISIAILIVHLLDPNPLRERLLYAMVILQVIFAIVSVFIVFFQCNPTAMMWNPLLDGKCWSSDIFNDFSYWVSAYTTLTDIALAIVPINAFWKLHMPMSTKINVCIMMGLTMLSAIVTIVKATYLHLFTDHSDPLFNVVPLVLWGLIEQNVVIVAACVPTLRPFFRTKFKSSKGSTNAANSRSRSGSTFKLSSKPSHSRNPFDSEGRKYTNNDIDFDVESNSSRQGIWRTREVIVE